jgi:hypothetical protein
MLYLRESPGRRHRAGFERLRRLIDLETAALRKGSTISIMAAAIVLRCDNLAAAFPALPWVK